MSMPEITPTAEPTCYRHKDRITYLSCGRCGKPLCPDCAEHGPVGIRCAECLHPVGRMVPTAQLAEPEREGTGIAASAGMALAGLVASVIIALLQIPPAHTLVQQALESGIDGMDLLARYGEREIIGLAIGDGAVVPAPNLLVAMVVGGLVGWVLWRVVGRSWSRRTAIVAAILGAVVPLLAAVAIAMVGTAYFGTPALFSNGLFWMRALAGAALGGFFAWLMTTQRNWTGRDLF